MTKKKRELIEILLDNITPDDFPVMPGGEQ